jgi:hypothetical protein
MKITHQILTVLIISLTLLILSCKPRKIDNEVIKSLEFTILKINPKQVQKDNNKISLFSNSIKYIPLETQDSILVGSIDKIVTRNNKIYILDKMTETIFCFNIENGKFLYKLNKKGNGPNEYFSVMDFNVNEDEEIVIYSSNQGLLFYDNNRFVKKIDLSIIASDFYIDRKDTIYFHLGRFPNQTIFQEFPKQYRLIKTVKDTIIDKYLPYEYNDYYLRIPIAKNSLFISQDTLNIIDYLNQETYSVVNGNISGKYKFTFTNNKETFNYNNSKTLNNSILEKIKKDNYTGLSSYLESENYIFISYNIEKFVMYSYIVKNDLKVNNLGIFYFDDFNNIPFGGHMLGINNNELIAFMEPTTLLDLIRGNNAVSENLRVLKNKLDPSNNPIIVIINLK